MTSAYYKTIDESVMGAVDRNSLTLHIVRIKMDFVGIQKEIRL